MTTVARLKELQRIVARLGDQDNLCTHQVMFCVQKATFTTGIDTDYTDDIAWLYQGELVPEEHWPFLSEAHDNGTESIELYGEHYELSDLLRTGYERDWETVQVFFTSEGAQRYIDANKHRLSEHGEPRIYGESFYRNDEMNAIREALPALLKIADLGHKCLPHVDPQAVDYEMVAKHKVSDCYLNTQLRDALAELENGGGA